MFCGECGAKCKKNDAFCPECGASLQTEEKDVKKEKAKPEPVKEQKEKRPMSKKNKIIIICLVVVLAILGGLYKVGETLTSPKKVAEEYIKALTTKNADKLYDYLEIEGDKTFVSKKLFSDVVKNKLTTSDVENYTITDVDIASSKLSATVTFKYTVKNSSSEKTSKVNLAKQKGKKYILFDDWKVSDTGASSTIVKDYKIEVMKGASLTFANIKVDSKYLSKEDQTDELDVYVLPQVFATKTKVKATLPNGLEMEEEITPGSYYNSHTIKFSESSLSKESKDSIINTSKDALTKIYTNAIEGKEFSEIKKDFEHGKLDLSDLEKNYNQLVSDLGSASNTLTSIEFTTAVISSIDLNSDNNFEVRLKFNYNYSVKYKNWKDEEQTHDDKDYDYMTVILSYDKGNYYLINVNNLEYSFSRY